MTAGTSALGLISWAGRLLAGCQSLLKGMGVTWRYLINPKTVVTQQYPENRLQLKMFDRFRSCLTMVHDENGYNQCTACRLCEQACPNGSIKVLRREQSATGKPELDYYLWRFDSCTFCNACVQVCPWSVLKMSGEFESAVYDRRLLVYNLTRYAGPTAKELGKVSDPAVRQGMIELRTPYSGPVPAAGHAWPGLRGLVLGDPPADRPGPAESKSSPEKKKI